MSEQKEAPKPCSECVFWDYKKDRCSKWFELEIPNDSLHKCAYRYREGEE